MMLHMAGDTNTRPHNFAQKSTEVFNLKYYLTNPVKYNEILWKVKRLRDS